MAINDFDFVTQKNNDIKKRQAIVSFENDADVETLSKILKTSKVHVLGQTNEGNTALELVRKHKTGIFFLDFDIQSLGSMTVLEKIRATCPSIKTVVLANKLGKDQVSEAKKLGVVGFLAKPLTNDAINKIMSKLL